MTRKDDVPERKDVRTSPSGRVPQWVMDEALGKPTNVVPFRASPTPPPKPK